MHIKNMQFTSCDYCYKYDLHIKTCDVCIGTQFCEKCRIRCEICSSSTCKYDRCSSNCSLCGKTICKYCFGYNCKKCERVTCRNCVCVYCEYGSCGCGCKNICECGLCKRNYCQKCLPRRIEEHKTNPEKGCKECIFFIKCNKKEEYRKVTKISQCCFKTGELENISLGEIRKFGLKNCFSCGSYHFLKCGVDTYCKMCMRQCNECNKSVYFKKIETCQSCLLNNCNECKHTCQKYENDNSLFFELICSYMTDRRNIMALCTQIRNCLKLKVDNVTKKKMI